MLPVGFRRPAWWQGRVGVARRYTGRQRAVFLALFLALFLNDKLLLNSWKRGRLLSPAAPWRLPAWLSPGRFPRAAFQRVSWNPIPSERSAIARRPHQVWIPS